MGYLSQSFNWSWLMSRYSVVLAALVALLFSGVTLAECHLDGRIYEEGAVVAGYICNGGNWQEM